jgi:flagellar basal-body rod modification protein FlgD
MSVGNTGSSTNSTNSTSNTSNSTVSSTDQGFNALTSNDFMKLLITELQNQDPTQPMDNSQLLDQLSQMRNLQASVDLDTTLSSLTISQQLNSGASFLGKAIQGTDANNNQVTGIVSSVLVSGSNATLVVGNSQVPIANVTAIAPADALTSVGSTTDTSGDTTTTGN